MHEKSQIHLFSLVLMDFFFHQKITRLLHDATLIFLDSCINTLFFQNYLYWNSICCRTKYSAKWMFVLDSVLMGASLIAQLVKNPPAMQETPVRFLGREDPGEKG